VRAGVAAVALAALGLGTACSNGTVVDSGGQTGAGAGQGTGAGAGTGASGGGTSSGGTSFPPDGAWSFNMNGESSGTETCQLGAIAAQLGDVRSTEIITRIADGTMPATENGLTASVSCSVIGTTSFAVQASASVATNGEEPSKSLAIDIPVISNSASMASPASGTAAFSSTTSQGTAGLPYSGTCDFYFIPGSSEGVASGKIWGAFTCASVMNAQQQSACGVSVSYFVFENCATE
jgi:hypothetical protein